MKKSKIVFVVCALCIAALCLVLFVHWRNLHKIDADQVEKIQLGNTCHQSVEVLNAEDTAKFIELFNFAKYAGKANGEGGTPDWTVSVYYRDGSYLTISEFGSAGSTCEVTLRNADRGKKVWYYVKSEELRAFILEMMDQN